MNCSSADTEFNGAETNGTIAHNLGILLMNSNCLATIFSSILVIFPKGLDNSKKNITRINTTTFLKDMFRHAYTIISLIE